MVATGTLSKQVCEAICATRTPPSDSHKASGALPTNSCNDSRDGFQVNSCSETQTNCPSTFPAISPHATNQNSFSGELPSTRSPDFPQPLENSSAPCPDVPTDLNESNSSESACDKSTVFPLSSDLFSVVSSDEEAALSELFDGKTLAEYLRSEEEQLREEIARLQREDAERLRREKLEREKWIDQIRQENYVLSSEEEEEWKEEEEEASRRRTVFITTIGKEMEHMLTEMQRDESKQNVSRKKVIQFSRTKSRLQERVRENEAQQQREATERRKRELEQRQLAARNRAITDQKQRQQQEQLRKERRAFEKKLKEEALERERKEKERRQRDEQLRLKQLSLMKKQEEEEKKKKKEKKKQWLEEKRRLEEEDRRKEEMEKQKRRQNLIRIRNETTKVKSGCVDSGVSFSL